MKRKDLYNYIREEIINELTEAANLDLVYGNVSINSDISYNSSNKSDAKKKIDQSSGLDSSAKNAAKNNIDKNPGGTIAIRKKSDAKKTVNQSKLNSDTKNTNKQTIDKNPSGIITNLPLEETDLEEMANIASILKIQDPTKLALAKEIYSTGRYADVLSAIETAGEEGTTQKQLGQTLGINDTVLNPIINNLRVAGVLSPKREKIVKPEKPVSTSEPEEEEPTDTTKADDFYKVDKDFDSSEEEPTSVIDKYAEELGKLNNRLSQLIAKKNDILKKYKDGDINLDQYKAEIGTIPSQIKKIQDKITDYSKID